MQVGDQRLIFASFKENDFYCNFSFLESLNSCFFWKGMQQKQVMHGQHIPFASRGKPPLPPSGPSADGEIQANQKKSKVPVLEKHLADQLSKEEQNSLNSRFQEAMEADKKVNIC